MVQRGYAVLCGRNPQRTYPIVVERGGLSKLGEHIPASAGKLFFLSTEDVWQLHGDVLRRAIGNPSHEVLFFCDAEARKRLAELEVLAEQTSVSKALTTPRYND